MENENNDTSDGAEFPEAIQDETLKDVDLRGAPYKRKVEVQVSDEEILERHDQHLKLELEIDRVKAERAAELADYTGQLKELRQRRQELINAIHTKKELREFDVYDREINDDAGNILRFEICRWDTNEVVDERAATPDEDADRRQPALFDDLIPEPEATPEEAADAAEAEGRVIRTNSAEVKKKRKRKLQAVESNGEGETEEASA